MPFTGKRRSAAAAVTFAGLTSLVATGVLTALLVASIGAILLPGSVAADTDLTTYYEKSDYKATPPYAETVAYCKQLDEASPWLHYMTFGITPQGRDMPLLIADKEGRFDPHNHGDNAILLVQGGIHSGEIGGKDAGFLLLRDIAVDKTLESLLDHVTIVFIPIFNVDGHERRSPYNRINQNGPEEMGWRVNAQNLNLNRDYLKIDTPELRYWLKLWNDWNPDFFIDCHATDGADYQYVLTYIMEQHGNIDRRIAGWTKDRFLKTVEPRMKEAGFEMFPYVYLLEWPNPKAGLRSWVSTPRFSTGYTALCNRPGLLIETHMMKPYRTRVEATYTMIRETLVELNADTQRLRKLVREADEYAASRDFRKQPFPLRFEPVEPGRTIDFKGVAYDTVTSDLTGGPWYRFTGEPETFKIEFREAQKVTVSAQLPEAYIIPREWTDVIERISIHGVKMRRLLEETTVEVGSYRFKNVKWAEQPYEARHPLTFETEAITEERTFAAGSIVIDMSQARSRVVANILEPHGADSFVQWGFFDAIFEQKEYAESYVMEKMAREMIAKDPALLDSLNARKEADPEFAKNPFAQLNWFYQHTPYWDQTKDIYPVGKIFDGRLLKKILKSTEEV